MSAAALVAAIFAFPAYHGPRTPQRLFPSLHIVVPAAQQQPDTPPNGQPDQPPAPPPKPTYPSRTGVDEGEYWVYPAHGTLAAGDVELNAHNYGQDDHDLTIADAQGTVLAQAYLTPGDEYSFALTLPAGTYRLYCSLYDGAHAQLGMDTTLTIAG
jgi:plastocyanin